MHHNKHNSDLLCIRLVTSSALAMIMASGCAAHKSVRFDAVMEANALAHQLDRPSDTRILDVRNAASYERGHVVGAVHIDAKEWKKLSLAPPTGLDHRSAWYERIGLLGIDGDDEIIIYDSGKMTDAARIWFILQHFGVKRASVLNGGYPAIEDLIREGRIPVSQTASKPTPTRFHPAEGWDSTIKLIGREDVHHAIQHEQAQIFDTRSKAEYMGVERRDNPRAGHLPNAINLPHEDLLNERGHLKATEELVAMFEWAGFQRGEPIVTHCQSGGRASLAALAAARAGYGPVLNYYLSFGDLAKNTSCPIVGPQPE